jgi:lipid II:glycine glycyltransferase (peptidoglycan interpeptide bridge formation enzyme)
MADYRIETIHDRKQWDDFVTSRPDTNFLQSYSFGDFHERLGWPVVRRAAFDTKGNIIAAYTGYVEPARRGRHLAIPGGPVCDQTKTPLVKALLDDMRTQGRRLHCVFVRLRPQWPEAAKTNQQLVDLGARPAPLYLSVQHAGVLDLTQSQDQILAGMRQRLRRALRKAAKAGITVETTTDPEAIKRFYQIELETAGRHRFVPFSERFLQKQFAAFAEHDEAVLYIAKHEGEILAENFMIFYGHEASYHYGVSTELGTKLSGAPLLHMAAMDEARRRGITRYNFWGIVEEDETNHRFYGVSTFKRGFGVTELRHTPAHDLVLRPWFYWAVTYPFETLRRHLRRVD